MEEEAALDGNLNANRQLQEIGYNGVPSLSPPKCSVLDFIPTSINFQPTKSIFLLI
jgi:hypothetical protein